MSIVRSIKDRENPYVQIDRRMLDNPNLSLKAKGFIGFCLGKPDNWTFYVSNLCASLKEGKSAIYSVIKECVVQGYAIRYQTRKGDGDFDSWETIISDSKDEILRIKEELKDLPAFQKMLAHRGFAQPQVAEPQNRTLTKKEESKTDNSNNDPVFVNKDIDNIYVQSLPSFIPDSETMLIAQKFKLSEEQTSVFYWLATLNLNTTLQTLSWWSKNYRLNRLQEVYNYVKSKNPDNIAAYMQSLLRKDAIVENDRMAACRSFAEDLKNSNNWNSLTILQKYAKLQTSNGQFIEIPFCMDPISFANYLIQLLEDHSS